LPKADGEVIVPSIPAGLTVAEAKATLSAAGLSAGFNAKGGKPDSENLEFKTSGAQDPPGGSKRKRGATVTVSIYQKYEPKTSPTPTPTPTPTPSTPTPTATSAPTASPSPAISPTQKTTGIPNLIGLTLEQAVARLPAKMEILSDEIGDKPPTPEKALTIFAQTPAAGTTFDPTKPPSVKVKRYGSAKSADGTTAAAGPFVGTWYGKSFYTRENDPPVTMFIRRDPDGSLSIWVEGRSGGYPLETDGVTKLWHKYGLTEITYELAGNTLRGTSRSTDWQGKSVIRNTTLQRK
jgi:hypothetical protein